MPKNSSAARRQAARQLAAAEGISYTAALRRLQAAVSEAAGLEPGHIGHGGDLPSRAAALDLLEQHRRYPVEVRPCQACTHVYLAHYGSQDGPQRGCVACEETGRACAVFVPGGVPKLSSHADPVSAVSSPCPWLCGHGLDEHAEGAGCYRCGCRYGEPGVPEPGPIVYHGYLADGPRGGRLVVIEAPEGNPVSLLPCLSGWTAGFFWGDVLAGSAALARSLLIGALGPAAVCPACHGAASLSPAEETHGSAGYEDQRAAGKVVPCPRCSDGYRGVPVRKFTSEVVASLDQDTGWVIGRDRILTWLSAGPANPYSDPHHPFWAQYGVQGTEWDEPRA